MTSPDSASTTRYLTAFHLRWSLNHFVATFATVPDDQLDYKPSETAKSIREIAQHIVGSSYRIAPLIGVEFEAGEIATDRAALAEQVTGITNAVIETIETMPDEKMDTIVEFFGNQIPMPRFLMIVLWHLIRHVGQIDYVQTIYGDLENHFAA